jgi:anti-sigma28 factor (negative regulator of flagellin synthesis)
MDNFDDNDELFGDLTVEEIEAVCNAQRIGLDCDNETGEINEREYQAVERFFPDLFATKNSPVTGQPRANSVVSHTPFDAGFVNSNASVPVQPSRTYKRKTPEEQATEGNQKRRKTNNEAVKRCREKQKWQREFEAAEHDRIVRELKEELRGKDAIIERQQNDIIELMNNLAELQSKED